MITVVFKKLFFPKLFNLKEDINLSVYNPQKYLTEKVFILDIMTLLCSSVMEQVTFWALFHSTI